MKITARHTKYLNLPIQSLRENKDKNKKEPFWSVRPTIKKKNGSGICVKFFDTQEHSGISAIIYSKDNVLNCRDKLGKECMLVHNPIALNPVPENVFPFFDQYKARENKIIKI